MELLTTSFFWVTLAQIMMINILLSGDNAVVIALASRSLPPRQQKQAILFGSFGAILLRVILTFFAVFLLELPFLKVIGALLLIWIGIKMLLPQNEGTDLDAHSSLWAAVKTIIIADFVMSLDNVLGVAAAAKGNVPLLVIGLVISIPLIIYGSTLVLKLMNRFSFIVTVGGGLLGWVAGEMLVSDPAISLWVDTQLPWAHTGGPVLATLAVVGTGKWFSWKESAQEERVSEEANVQLAPAPAFAVESVDTPAPAPVAFAAGEARQSAPAPMARVAFDGRDDAAPVGYRWVSSPWHTGRDGKRDYAATHGMRSFRTLAPMSGRVRPPRHR
ncbi:MAG: YjbE family putative metal transport protein [Betaproteobacteria bacterium]|nr:YjbE family putative metal transport protein [Betaproteobacteria bacterium]